MTTSKSEARKVPGMFSAILHAIRGLAVHPHLGRPADRPGVHELIVPRRPYKVYYRIERDVV